MNNTPTPRTDDARRRLQQMYDAGKLDIAIENTLLDMVLFELTAAYEEMDAIRIGTRFIDRDLKTVTEQRDRLAEACKLLMAIVGKPNSSVDSCWASEDEMDAAWNMGNEALQSLNQPTEP